MLRKKKYFLIVFMFFLLLNLLLFRDVIFSRDRLVSYVVSSDTFAYFASSKFLEKEALSKGLILWNPYFFSGTPWIANPQNQIFYPLNLPFSFLSFREHINYSLILHIFLIGIATFLLVRYFGLDWYLAMISGLITMFSGLIFLRCLAGHLLTINTYLWLPLIFLLIEMAFRKEQLIYGIFAGLALGCQILAGNPQYTYYTLLALFFYFVFTFTIVLYRHHKQPKIKFIFSLGTIFLVVGIGIAAFRLIPILEFAKLSNRSEISYYFCGSYSFPLRNLVTFIMPEFYGDEVKVFYWGKAFYIWEMCGYVGILPLILSIIGVVYKRNRYTLFFGILSILALLGSLGIYTFLFKLFYHFLPGYNRFRGHSKLIVLFIFSIGILSAYGLSWLTEKKAGSIRQLKRITFLLGIFAAMLVLFWLFVYSKYSSVLAWWINLWKTENLPLIASEFRFHCAYFSFAKFTSLVIIIFLIFFLWLQKKISLSVFKALVFIIIISDLLLFGAKYVVSAKAQKCYWDREVVSFLKNKEGNSLYRVCNFNNDIANNAVFDGISLIDGYDPLVLKRHIDFFNACLSTPEYSSCINKLGNMANLKYIIAPKDLKVDEAVSKIVYEKGNLKVLENIKYLPRAYIVHQAKIVKGNDSDILKAILENNFDPLRTVILEKEAKEASDKMEVPGESKDRVDFLKYSPNEVIVQAQLKSSGYLVLNDTNYPGWKVDIVNVDTEKKERREVLNANYLFRAVSLEKGNYVVRFNFRPFSFYLGCIISALTLVLVSISLFLIYRYKKYK